MTLPEEPTPAEPELPEYVIEGARSSRSRCKGCRRPIQMGNLRIGMRIEGPYGQGYLWFHLTCAAKRQIDRVEDAYAKEAWKAAKFPPTELPSLDDLKALVERAAEQKKEQRPIPHAELAPTSRSRCKHCQEPIEEGSARIVLARSVTFGRQVRSTPIFVHPRCVAAELHAEDCATESEGFEDELRANSAALPVALLASIVAEIGSLE